MADLPASPVIAPRTLEAPPPRIEWEEPIPLVLSDFSELLISLGPSLYWPLDALYGVTDISGNGRDGTASGPTIGGHVATYAPILGASASCTDLDGTDDRITSTFDPFVHDGIGQTFLGWANRDATGNQSLFGGTDAYPQSGVLQLRSGANDIQFYIGSTLNPSGSFWPPGVGSWGFFAVTFNDSTNQVVLYVDGTAVSTVTNAGTWGTGDFQVGAWGATQYMNGKMSHVAVFPSPLTAQNIADLYLAAVPAGIPDLVVAPQRAP